MPAIFVPLPLYSYDISCLWAYLPYCCITYHTKKVFHFAKTKQFSYEGVKSGYKWVSHDQYVVCCSKCLTMFFLIATLADWKGKGYEKSETLVITYHQALLALFECMQK